MSNMSYCRFQNTLSDFRECMRALQEEPLSELSPEERDAALALATYAPRFAVLVASAVELHEDGFPL